MKAPRAGRVRMAAAVGSLVGVTALLTAAALTDSADVNVFLDGSRNSFDIVAAGSSQAGWTPTESSWQQANPDAYRIQLTQDDSPFVISPGGTLDLRIAAKNVSPRLGAGLELTVRDPNPRGTATNPTTGTYLELWDQLVFTVKHGNDIIFDEVSANDLDPHVWDDALASGEHILLDVAISMPDSVDNRWQLASTDIQFNFEAVNE